MLYDVKTVVLYDMKTRKRGRYASQLEQHWADQFRSWGWDAEYIGHVYWGADFKIDGLRVEVKPWGTAFVEQACERGGCDVIVEGEPRWEAWWVIDGMYARCLVDSVMGRRCYATPVMRHGRQESLREFIERAKAMLPTIKGK